MGFLVYLILMPIVYCVLTSFGHYEGCEERHYIDIHDERNTIISFIIWTIIKLASYYTIEIIYCNIIKNKIDILPWKDHGFESVTELNTLFIISSIVFIIIHLAVGYLGAFYDEGAECPPFIHIIFLSILFMLFLAVFSGDINKELFKKIPYETSVEKVELHSLGDSFTINEEVISRNRYFNFKIQEGYTISYSYVKDGKLYVDNFVYSKHNVTIEEGNDDKAYLEIIKHFKSVIINEDDMYEEYFSYHIYLPKGSLSEEMTHINLDIN